MVKTVDLTLAVNWLLIMGSSGDEAVADAPDGDDLFSEGA